MSEEGRLPEAQASSEEVISKEDAPDANNVRNKETEGVANDPDVEKVDSPVPGDGPVEEKKEAEEQTFVEQESRNEVEPAPPADTDPSTPAQNPDNIGAQILKNRFLSMKERANQNAQNLWAKNSPALSENAKAVQERAGQLWKTAAPILPVTGFRKPQQRTAEEKEKPGTMVEEPEKVVGEGKGELGDVETYEVKPQQLALDKDTMEEASNGSEAKAEVANNTANQLVDDDENPSVGGVSDVATRLLSGKALTRASLAASVAYESVATFRGRYNTAGSTSTGGDKDDNNSAKSEESVIDKRPMPESQVELILKSRVGQHMQEILDRLEPHEFAMLLGRGMLGVNLKQCFLKNHGVFVDFMVPGGQAENSGVIRSGDLLVRLGDADLRKGTILDIPMQIAQARRPVVLTLATGSKVALERMNYIDVAVAMMHRARDYYTKRGSLSNLPSASASPSGEAAKAEQASTDIKSVSDNTIEPADTLDCYLTPPVPNLDILLEFHDECPLRNLDKFLVDGLAQVYDLDVNFREAVRNAFLTCALDGRRLPFLSRHFSSDDQNLVDASPKMTPSAQLMLFLELTSFLDLYYVTPALKLREMATRIAEKFFLPTTVGSKLQPPIFDFHHIVSDASLRHLELVLNSKTESIPREIFSDFSKAVVDSLCQPFISFLTSTECSRMRAYLRDTAPFVNLPLHDMINSLTGKTKNSVAKNCFAYLLLFLICHVEKEPAGEYNFSGDDESKMRLLGASNDLCCAIFIRRTFLPALDANKDHVEGLVEGEMADATIVETTIKVMEKFWDVFVIGTMELSSRQDLVDTPFKAIRLELSRVTAEIVDAMEIKVIRSSRETAEIITKSRLQQLATELADELVYSFAANVNAKFREHKFHEWMCNEISKIRAKDPTWCTNQEIPTLPQGCVKRLLRKADLPDGISPHKPHREDASDESEDNYPNAEFAVVFGSTVGEELASEIETPGLESGDIRRYTCLPVALDKNHDLQYSAFSADEAIPPTFEGYAAVPPRKRRPFQSAHSIDTSVSEDHWDVSMVSFTVPNAGSSGASASLYGVSLFLQCSQDRVAVVQDRIDSFQFEEDKTVAPNAFVSPISVSTAEKAESDAGIGDILVQKGEMKTVSVSSPLPAFNDKLKSESWVSRVLGEEHRDSSQPISIGIALVSRKNVIPAMRDTLSRLLFDHSRGSGENSSLGIGKCGPLADVLGNFANRGVESWALRCILEPYLQVASTPWIDRPISIQASIFEKQALHQVTDCLPSIPLALMFITALLEQKIVLSSSRRSVLLSSTTALTALLDPLKWSHLLVPMVPVTLAGDLVQYPAPFILGVPSEEAENEELIGKLPRDVTLVDLDVGRVILAPEFGLDNEMVRKSDDPAATASALRSQVLYLAQALGSTFAERLKPHTWLCDLVSRSPPPSVDSPTLTTEIEGLKETAKSFVAELLDGVSACCYWIEEVTQTEGAVGEPTVLFDEDKFFEIKNHRAKESHKPLFAEASMKSLALNLTDFDLVLESFLRCQSMSTYISSRSKTDMVYY